VKGLVTRGPHFPNEEEVLSPESHGRNKAPKPWHLRYFISRTCLLVRSMTSTASSPTRGELLGRSKSTETHFQELLGQTESLESRPPKLHVFQSSPHIGR
jgi:hypothetical protein